MDLTWSVDMSVLRKCGGLFDGVFIQAKECTLCKSENFLVSINLYHYPCYIFMKRGISVLSVIIIGTVLPIIMEIYSKSLCQYWTGFKLTTYQYLSVYSSTEPLGVVTLTNHWQWKAVFPRSSLCHSVWARESR